MSFYKKTVKNVPIAGKTVLLRADYNVPLTDDGKIHDDYRIRQSVATIHYLLEQNCKVVICSHLGRPEGRVDQKYTLEPVATRLKELLEHPVRFVHQSLGDVVTQTVKNAKQGDVILLENVRFHPGEEANDAHFAARLAHDSTAQYFVQDGFGVVHRAHATTEAITQDLPSVAGLLLEKEYTSITNSLEHPKRPLVIVLGGAKVSDKIPVIERFIELADSIVIGGAIANTFLKFYSGCPIGKSVYDEQAVDVVAMLMDRVHKKWCTDSQQVGDCKECIDNFILPRDVAVASAIKEDEERREIALEQVGEGDYILDIGTKTIGDVITVLEQAHTVIWNGPLGYAEFPQFAYGSNFVAGALANNKAITSVVGGGDTADFVIRWAKENHVDAKTAFSHISTGGGASLELMAGDKLPGVEALMDV